LFQHFGDHPPPDDNGYWHHTYVTYDPDTGEWYGGKHSTKNLYDGYRGSGDWVRYHPHKSELVTEIVEFFSTETGAFAAERQMITQQVIDNDPLCRNVKEGGDGMSSISACRRSQNPAWKLKNRMKLLGVHSTAAWRDGIARRSDNQNWLRAKSAATTKAFQDPKVREAHRAGIEKRALNPNWLDNRRAFNALQRQQNPDWGKGRRKALAKTMQTAEWKEAQRAGCVRLWQDPAHRTKMREAEAKAKAAKSLTPGQLNLPFTG
jgi:hypothetical protein